VLKSPNYGALKRTCFGFNLPLGNLLRMFHSSCRIIAPISLINHPPPQISVPPQTSLFIPIHSISLILTLNLKTKSYPLTVPQLPPLPNWLISPASSFHLHWMLCLPPLIHHSNQYPLSNQCPVTSSPTPLNPLAVKLLSVSLFT